MTWHMIPENHLGIPVLAQGPGPDPCQCSIGTSEFEAALEAAGWGAGHQFGPTVETVLCAKHRGETR